jgi:hypothetical protein
MSEFKILLRSEYIKINKMAMKLFLSKSNSKRGATAILFTFLIITVTLLIALGLATIFISETKKSRLVGYTGTAFYAGDAGAEYALYQIIMKSNYSGNSVPLTLQGSKATASVTWTSNSVNSWGFFSGTRRRVQISW